MKGEDNEVEQNTNFSDNFWLVFANFPHYNILVSPKRYGAFDYLITMGASNINYYNFLDYVSGFQEKNE